jgi:hypothetical protein
MTVVCDPDILTKLKNRLRNKIIYLDSNVVYRLLGLQGERRQNILKSVVSLCHEYELSLKIHYQTFRELKRRIKYDSEYLTQYSYDAELAKIAASHYHTVENYITTYWEESKKGVTKEAFIERYNNFELLLGEYNVVIEKEKSILPNDLERKLIDVKSKLKKIRANHKKTDKALEHDAYLLVYLEYLCEKYNSFIDYPAWLLTSDSSVIKYYEQESKSEEKTPYALLPGQMIQLLQFTTTTTNLDYEQAYVNIFTKNFIKCEMLNNDITSETIHEILGYINVHQGDRPELAEKILSNTLLMKKYQSHDNDRMKMIIINEQVNELNAHRIKSIEDKIDDTDRVLSDIKNSISKMAASIDETSTTKVIAHETLLSEVSAITSKVNSLDDLKNNVNKALNNVNSQIRLIKSLGIIILPAILFLYSLFNEGYYRIPMLVISLLALIVSCITIYHIYYSIKKDDVKKTAINVFKCLQLLTTITAAALALYQYYVCCKIKIPKVAS